MDSEYQKQFDEILLSLETGGNPEEKRKKLALSISELSIELDDNENFLSRLIREGGDAFPEEIQHHINNIRVLISKLELEKDKLESNIPNQAHIDTANSASKDERDFEDGSNPVELEKNDIYTKPYLNITELSQYTGIPRGTLYKYTHRREIPFSKPGGILIFDRKKIDSWLEEKGKKQLF